MYAPGIMIIDVEKALKSSSVWKMMKKNSQNTASSCIVYKELTWDELDDLEYSLRSVGSEISDETFPELSHDYTLIASGDDGGAEACLLCSCYDDVLWINMLVSFNNKYSYSMRLIEKLASELWLTDDESRPSTVMFLSTDPDIELLVNKIFEEKYNPEIIEYSDQEEPEKIPADSSDQIRRDIKRKLIWKEMLSAH